MALKSSQKQLRLKGCWYKDTLDKLNHFQINKNVILQNINNLKYIVSFKFQDKMWCNRDLEIKT